MRPNKELLLSMMSEDIHGCWIWNGPRNAPNGYGVISYDGTSMVAHRMSYELHVGPIPEGLHVLHKCDVRPCINPSHLFVGTRADNMQDMVRKGRNANNRGERSPTAKLSQGDVQKIRMSASSITKLRGRPSRATSGRTVSDVAREFGVSRRTVQLILQGKTWRTS